MLLKTKLHDLELTINNIIELTNQHSVKEMNKDFETVEKTITVEKLTEGLNLIKPGMKILENINSDDQRVLATLRKCSENFPVFCFYMGF